MVYRVYIGFKLRCGVMYSRLPSVRANGQDTLVPIAQP